MNISKTFSTIAIIFTLITISSSLLNLALGIKTDTNFHILARFVLTAIGVSSLYIFKWLNHLPSYLAHLTHYVVTLLLVFIVVWLSQIIEPLSQNAYRDVFFNYTGIYIIVSIMYGLILYYKKKKR